MTCCIEELPGDLGLAHDEPRHSSSPAKTNNASLVSVLPMVFIRKMRMSMLERFVPMPVRMFYTGGADEVVWMLVVLVMNMFVVVFHEPVNMSVLVAFCQV